MEKHVGEKRVAGNDAGRFTAVHGMDGSGVFDGIELALSFDGVFDAGVFFHGNGFDPGHEESSLSWDGDGRKGYSVSRQQGRSSAAPLQGHCTIWRGQALSPCRLAARFVELRGQRMVWASF